MLFGVNTGFVARDFDGDEDDAFGPLLGDAAALVVCFLSFEESLVKVVDEDDEIVVVCCSDVVVVVVVGVIVVDDGDFGEALISSYRVIGTGCERSRK